MQNIFRVLNRDVICSGKPSRLWSQSRICFQLDQFAVKPVADEEGLSGWK